MEETPSDEKESMAGIKAARGVQEMITLLYIVGCVFGWWWFSWLGLILILIADALLEG